MVPIVRTRFSVERIHHGFFHQDGLDNFGAGGPTDAGEQPETLRGRRAGLSGARRNEVFVLDGRRTKCWGFFWAKHNHVFFLFFVFEFSG